MSTSATKNILIGLGLGTFLGLFLGEHAALLEFMADGYLRLLQMTVFQPTRTLGSISKTRVMLGPETA